MLYERERLEWQVNELEKLAVKPGEWAEVSNEQSRLSHAASLLEGAQEALAAISESEDHPIVSQLSGLNQKLVRLVSAILVASTTLRTPLAAGSTAAR